MGHGVVQQARWKVNDRIEVGWVQKATCIVLRQANGGGEGFLLGYSDARHKTGGKIQCKAFIQNYLQTLIDLPKHGLEPVFFKDGKWSVALLLETLGWVSHAFSKTDANRIPPTAVGVYELLGKGDAVLRIGEGKIRERIDAHLKDIRFAPPTVKSIRYLDLDSSEDSQLIEKMLIAKYEAETGILPRFQEIRA